VETRAGRLALSMNRFSLENLRFGVRTLELDSSYCAVRIFQKGAPKEREHNPQLPRIAVNSLNATNAHFVFEDTVSRNSILAKVDRINIGKGDADLNTEVISAGTVVVQGAAVGLALTAAKALPTDAPPPATGRPGDHQWRISAGVVDLRESRFDLDMLAAPRRKSGFDPAHMHLRDIAVLAGDAHYSARVIRAKLKHAAAQDSAGIALKKCAVDFSMDEKGISAQNLAVATTSSDIRATGWTGFSPFAEKKGLPAMLPSLPLNAVLQPSVVSTGEIGAFFPAVAENPPLKGG